MLDARSTKKVLSKVVIQVCREKIQKTIKYNETVYTK